MNMDAIGDVAWNKEYSYTNLYSHMSGNFTDTRMFSTGIMADSCTYLYHKPNNKHHSHTGYDICMILDYEFVT